MNKSLSGWTIVFDLDGTLIDTAPDLVAALNHTLKVSGHAPVADDIGRRYIGHGAKAMLRAGLAAQEVNVSETELTEMWQIFLTHYTKNIARQSAPFPGCLTALHQLTQHGSTLAVCTNKTQALADQLLKALGLATRFAAIVGADTAPAKKPSGRHIEHTVHLAGGDIRRAIMIGDSDTDEKAARDAGLPFILVDFGYGPWPDTSRGNFTALSSYDDLLNAILTINR